MAVDRTKYMSAEEVRQLRTVAEARAIVDLKAGRVNGVLGWMVVDLALSTGLRVSEIAKVNVEDIDLKRGLVTVNRAKKRKRVKPEPLAIGKELADHLKAYLAWRAGRISDLQEPMRAGLVATKGPLFVGCRGPLTAQGLQRVWKAAVKRAGLPAGALAVVGNHRHAKRRIPAPLNSENSDAPAPRTPGRKAQVSFVHERSRVDDLWDFPVSRSDVPANMALSQD